jgi:hypothetical protein
VHVLQKMLGATFGKPATTFGELRVQAVAFIDTLLAQGPSLPPAAAGLIAKVVLAQLRASKLDLPAIDDCDGVRDRVQRKIAPLVDSATGRGKKLKRDAAADIFKAALGALGLGALSRKVSAAAAGSGRGASPARAPGRRRARRRPRDL